MFIYVTIIIRYFVAQTLHALDKMGAVAMCVLPDMVIVGCTDGCTRVVTLS